MKKRIYLLLCVAYFSMTLSTHAVFTMRNDRNSFEDFEISIYTKVKKSEIKPLEKTASNLPSRIIPLDVIIDAAENSIDLNTKKLNFNAETEEIIFNKAITVNVKSHNDLKISLEDYATIGDPLFLTIKHPILDMLFLYQPNDSISTKEFRKRKFRRDPSTFSALENLLEQNS